MNAAKGNFDGPRQDYQIDANDQLVTSHDYTKVVVAYRNGAPVMLTDVAHILDGVENSTQAAWMNQTPAVILNVQRQPGGNTISVVKSIKTLLPQLEANLPKGIDVTTLTDLTTPIQASVSDVEFELHADHRAGRDGHLLVPAQSVRDDHSQRSGAVVADRYLRRDVCAWLQSRQLIADGVDDLDWVCRRRRDRDGGEHLALPGRGRFADAGGVEGRGADRVSRFFR